MTEKQREIARKKSVIHGQKVINALYWLLKHNKEWQKLNIDVHEIKKKLHNTLLLDNSIIEKTEKVNEINKVECVESFQV